MKTGIYISPIVQVTKGCALLRRKRQPGQFQGNNWSCVIFPFGFIPLNPNMDSPNSRSIQSPVEITWRSHVFFFLLISKFTQMERFLLGITFSNWVGGICTHTLYFCKYLFRYILLRCHGSQRWICEKCWWLRQVRRGILLSFWL